MKKIAVQSVSQLEWNGTITDVTVISINGSINAIFLPGQVTQYDKHIEHLYNLGYELKIEED